MKRIYRKPDIEIILFEPVENIMDEDSRVDPFDRFDDDEMNRSFFGRNFDLEHGSDKA